MSYLEVFGVLTGVRVDVPNFYWVGADVESEKCDSADLWFPHLFCWPYIPELGLPDSRYFAVNLAEVGILNNQCLKPVFWK